MPNDDPFERLEAAAEAVAHRAAAQTERVAYEAGNRLGLLWVHAVVALLAGTQMLLWGSASQVEAVLGPTARLPMGLLAVVGGLWLSVGLTRKPRSIPAEAVGLCLVALWDLAMTLSLAYARARQHDYHLLGLRTPMPDHYVPAYPVSVYGGLLALLVIHLLTLRHVWRGHRHGDAHA